MPKVERLKPDTLAEDLWDSLDLGQNPRYKKVTLENFDKLIFEHEKALLLQLDQANAKIYSLTNESNHIFVGMWREAYEQADSLKIERDDLFKNCERLEIQVTGLKDELSASQSMNESIRQQRDDLHDKASKLQKENEDLEDELVSQEAKFTERGEKLAGLRSLHEEVVKECRHHKREHKLLLAVVETLEFKNEKLKTSYQVLDQKGLSHSEAYETAAKIYEDKITSLRADVKRLQDDVVIEERMDKHKGVLEGLALSEERDKIATLRENLRHVRAAYTAKRQWEADTIQTVRRQGRRIEELHDQLQEFGGHKRDCNYTLRTHLEHKEKDCTCGWEEIEE